MRLTPHQVRILQEMGISWPALAVVRKELVWVAILARPASSSEGRLLRNILASIEMHLKLQTRQIVIAPAPLEISALAWVLNAMSADGTSRLGFLTFGIEAEQRLLGSSHSLGEVWRSGQCYFVAVESLTALAISAEGKRRLWQVLCEIPI